MSLPPLSPPGPHSSNDPWQPTSSPPSDRTFPPGAPQNSHAGNFGPPTQGGPYGYPPTGPPRSGPPGGPFQQYLPPPPPPTSSGGGVIKWLVIGCLGCSGIAVLAFVALIIIGMIGGADDDSSSEASSTTQDSDTAVSDGGGDASDGGGDTSGAEDSAAAADPTDAAAGRSGESDAATITVTSTERTDELQDSIFEYTTNNEYFVVDLEYANKSDESHDLWASDFVLVDAQGNEYSTNTDVSLAVADPLIIEEVNPGLAISGTLVFEIPPGTEFTELRLEESYGTREAITIAFD